MKKILVLVLALLCVFAACAMAETEKFVVNMDGHTFLAVNQADDYGVTEKVGTFIPGRDAADAEFVNFTHTHSSSTQLPWLVHFGTGAATCDEGKYFIFMCVDADCAYTDGLVKIFVSEPNAHVADTTKDRVGYQAPACGVDGWTEYPCANCKTGTAKVPVAAEPHKYDGGVYHEATCTEGAYTLYTCGVCGNTYTVQDLTVNEGKALGHTFKRDDAYREIEITKVNETCTEAGEVDVYNACFVCGALDDKAPSYTIYPEKLEHDFEDLLEFVPDVDEDGEEVYNAAGDLYVVYDAKFVDLTEDEDFLDGTFTEVLDEFGFPVLDEDGETVMKQECGPYTLTVVVPTCRADGSMTITCVSCGATETYAFEATGHDWQVYARVSKMINAFESVEEYLLEDCTRDGYIVYQCKNSCGEIFQQADKGCKEHEYDDDAAETRTTMYQTFFFHGKQVVTEDGANDTFKKVDCLPTTYVVECACEGCEVDYTYTEEPTAIDEETGLVMHGAKKDYQSKAATCKEPGYEVFHCDDCEYAIRNDFEVDPDAHDYEWEITAEPVCGEKDGTRTGTCEICGNVTTETIPYRMHKWEPDLDKWEEATCTVPGLHAWYCAYCDATDEEVQPAGHKYTLGDVDEFVYVKAEMHHIKQYIAPTCQTAGSISYSCLVCHLPVYDLKLDIIPCNFEEVAKDLKAPDCFNGTRHHWECTMCGADDYRFDDDATGHLVVDEAEVKKILADAFENKQDLTYRYLIVSRPTCTEPGKGYVYCNHNVWKADYSAQIKCEHEIEFEIPALGHNWEAIFDKATGNYRFVCVTTTDTGIQAKDEFGQNREGCGATDAIEVRKPVYIIEIEGKNGTLTKTDDDMSNLEDAAYVRIVLDFQTKDGVSTSLIFMADVEFKGEVGTFKVPVVKTGMTMTGSSFLVVDDADADEMRYSQITNKYGELNL